jgi:hypothetical protein
LNFCRAIYTDDREFVNWSRLLRFLTIVDSAAFAAKAIDLLPASACSQGTGGNAVMLTDDLVRDNITSKLSSNLKFTRKQPKSIHEQTRDFFRIRTTNSPYYTFGVLCGRSHTARARQAKSK